MTHKRSIGNAIGSILTGILIVLIVPVCLLGGLALLLENQHENRIIMVATGAVVLLVSVWLVSIAWRLFTGRQRTEGGLLSPFVLRITAIGMMALSIRFTIECFQKGDFSNLLKYPVLDYLIVAVFLFFLAHYRNRISRRLREQRRPQSTEQFENSSHSSPLQ